MEKSRVRELLLRIEMQRRLFLKPRFLEIGLTVGQGQPRILNYLKKYGTMTQRELSDICCIDVTTISRTIDRMEEAGWLKRKATPGCRRSYQIVLTEKGLKKAGQVQEIFALADEKIWEGFDEKEMEKLYGGLEKIERSLKGGIQNHEAALYEMGKGTEKENG